MRKTALITGASRGIGRATAVRLARDGYDVAVHYNRSRDLAESLVRDLTERGERAVAVQADVSNRAEVEAMFRRVRETLGPVYALVNNAGVAHQGLFTDTTPSQWDRLFAVNVAGVYHCCQCALKDMIHAKDGVIVNVSSMWGIVGASCEAAYSATKAAVIGLTKALAKEEGPSGVRVNCVAPGVVDTDMIAALDEDDRRALLDETPLGCILAPSDVANAIAFLVSPDARTVTGQTLSPNGGFVV